MEKMKAWSDSDKPNLLMLSHCIPAALGTPQRVRAWQLLRLTCPTYRVFLAGIADGPVSLDQWRAIADCTDTVVFEPSRLRRKWASRCKRGFDGPAADWLAISAALNEPIHLWLRDYEFDAVLCTHPGLWPKADSLEPKASICDMFGLPSRIHRHLAQTCNPVQGWWRDRQTIQWKQSEKHVVDNCKVVTFSRRADHRRFWNPPCQSMVIPEALDLESYILKARKDNDANPRLLVYADHQSPGGRAAADRFMRKVAPVLQQTLGNIKIERSHSLRCRDPLAQMRRATVVVVPDPESTRAAFPVLQAMALKRPVVASERAVQHLELRHGKHLLLTRQDSDWARYCIGALRSAPVQKQLAAAGRTFVEKQCSIDNNRIELLCAIQTATSSTQGPLNRAA